MRILRAAALTGTSLGAIAAGLTHPCPRDVPTSDPRLRLTA